jgi:hypothetical protein
LQTGVASKELPGAEQKLHGQDKFLSALPRPPAGPYANFDGAGEKESGWKGKWMDEGGFGGGMA